MKETAKESDSQKNRLYRYFILKSLKSLIKKKAKLFPEIYIYEKTKEVKTIRDFDEIFQAPISYYKNAEDYYEKCSAKSKIKFIKIPTLIIYSQDDTLVPAKTLENLNIKNNENIIELKTKHGGHVGFISKNTQKENQFWADNRILEFFKSI